MGLGMGGPRSLNSVLRTILFFNFAFLWVGLIFEAQVANMATSSSRLTISLQLVLPVLLENVLGKTLIGLCGCSILFGQIWVTFTTPRSSVGVTPT